MDEPERIPQPAIGQQVLDYKGMKWERCAYGAWHPTHAGYAFRAAHVCNGFLWRHFEAAFGPIRGPL